ncbi:LamG-like jellyroll fold domain-containing protein [bacterium]
MCKKLLWLTCAVLLLSLATVSSADLLVHYKLDETSGTVVADASGNGFDGTINGNVDFVEGTIDGALEFWGTENITFPAETMGMTSFIGSVSFWMNAEVPTSINTMFWAGDNITGGGFGAENEMHMHLESVVQDIWIGGELSFYIRADPNPNVHLHSDPEKGGADAPGNVPVNPTLLGDAVWHHIAGVWDGNAGTSKLYIDGILTQEWPYEANIYELTNMYMGQMANASRTYNGKLDDVRIYSDALTDVDIYYLFEKMVNDVDDSPANPQGFSLSQNYPNPFNPNTAISYTLSEAGQVHLNIYNVSGNLVTTLVDEFQGAGQHTLSWNPTASELASGVYFAQLKAGKQSRMIRMLLMK